MCGVDRQEIRTSSFKPCDLAPNAKENSEELCMAAFTGKVEEVTKLLSKGKKSFLGRTGKPVNPDSRDQEGFSALYLAVQEGHIPVVNALIHAHADPSLPGCRDGVTPLCLAAGEGHLTALMLLAARGACLNTPTAQGVSPLLIAAQNGHAEAVSFLMEKKASVDACTPGGDSPLVCAARNGHLEVARLLVEGGARRDCKGQGKRPVEWVQLRVHDKETRQALIALLQE